MALAALWVAGRVLVLTPLRDHRRDRQCGVSRGRRGRHRHSARAEPAIGATISSSCCCSLLALRRARMFTFPISDAPAVAGAGEPASRSRCRSVHHGRDGRARDPDVHQQRHTRARRPRATRWSKNSRWAACSSLLGADLSAGSGLAHCRDSRSSLPSRTRYDSTCGSRGGRGHAPLVWVLHVAYGWIVVHLVLRGLAAIGMVGATVRRSRADDRGDRRHDHRHDDAHRTRPYRTPAGRRSLRSRVLRAVALAAAIRVFGGMLLPGAYLATVVVSGVCWSAAFALYAIRYWPVLSRARLDGKPG